jgi:hypothetical protein
MPFRFSRSTPLGQPHPQYPLHHTQTATPQDPCYPSLIPHCTFSPHSPATTALNLSLFALLSLSSQSHSSVRVWSIHAVLHYLHDLPPHTLSVHAHPSSPFHSPPTRATRPCESGLPASSFPLFPSFPPLHLLPPNYPSPPHYHSSLYSPHLNLQLIIVFCVYLPALAVCAARACVCTSILLCTSTTRP